MDDQQPESIEQPPPTPPIVPPLPINPQPTQPVPAEVPINVPILGEPEHSPLTDAAIEEILSGLLIPDQSASKALAREVKISRAEISRLNMAQAEANDLIALYKAQQK